MCGIVGWRRKLERSENAGQKEYLEAKDTLEKRTEDKLMEKTSWYKGNKKRKQENKSSKFQYQPPSKRMKKTQKKGGEEGKKVKAVMFVPYTAHSELANRLRTNEEKLEGMTG